MFFGAVTGQMADILVSGFVDPAYAQDFVCLESGQRTILIGPFWFPCSLVEIPKGFGLGVGRY